MPKQSNAQKKTVERVMHEFKHGQLKANGGRKVKNPKQAIAIALSEAGASDQQSPKETKKRLRQMKAKEGARKTGRDRTEGGNKGRVAKGRSRGGSRGRGGSSKTRAQLYEQAKRRDIPGRSSMNKAQLERALAR